ncbi:hypothetical protein BCR44DRAFT_1442979 [Catenaria anguillulae PL171]|uniref:Uncharacterized protein n=1 Tax=Catenaria anguillulae PL171 TaxID=765915 RepID=A0A1Y2HBZ8_9FUNG|nr:hypothetical protein BCR44DRAFT_1442979 [Catenaria anguillulae PL171]
MCKDKLSHFDWSLGDLPNPSTAPLETATMDESRSDSGDKDMEQGGGADASETGEMDVEGQERLAQESGDGEGDEGAASRRSRNGLTSKTAKMSDTTLMQWKTSTSGARWKGNGRIPSRKMSTSCRCVCFFCPGRVHCIVQL